MLSPKKTPLTSTFFFQFLSCVPILYHMFSILLPIFAHFLDPSHVFPSDFVSDYPCVRTTTVRRTWYIHVPASAGRVVSSQKHFLSNSSLVFCFFLSLHLRFRSVERSSLYTLLFVTTFPPLFCVSYLTWTY